MVAMHKMMLKGLVADLSALVKSKSMANDPFVLVIRGAFIGPYPWSFGSLFCSP